MHDPEAPQLLARLRIPDKSVDGVAVLDDGRVAVSSNRDALSIWDALGRGGLKTLVRAGGWPGVSDIDVDATEVVALVENPNGLKLVDLNNGQTVREFDAIDPDQPGSPITQTGGLRTDGRRVVAFNGAGHGYVFSVDYGAGLLLCRVPVLSPVRLSPLTT